MPVFRHGSLDTTSGRQSIRLLRVSAAKGTHGLLTCELSHDELSTRYQALSYEWGPALAPSASYPIYVTTTSSTGKEGVLLVRKNLHDFLTSVVARDSSAIVDSHTPLWIDAICINQDDKQEKNHQVQQMGEIYKGAERVLVWLGNHEQRCMTWMLGVLDAKASTVKRHARDFRLSGSFPKTMQDIVGIEAHALFLRLLSHSYFSRLWIIQEIILAQDIVLLVGSSWIAWKTVGAYLSYFEHTELWANQTSDSSIDGQTLSSSLPSAKFSHIYRRRQRLRYEEGLLGLTSLIELSKEASCSDPRDRIYGILSLISTTAGRFRVDYSECSAMLFLSAIVFFEHVTSSAKIQDSQILMRMLGVTLEEVTRYLAITRVARPVDTELGNIDFSGVEMESRPLKVGMKTQKQAVRCQKCGKEYTLNKQAIQNPYFWCLSLTILEGQHFNSTSLHMWFSPGSNSSQVGSSEGVPRIRLNGMGLSWDKPGIRTPEVLEFGPGTGLAATASIHEDYYTERDCVSVSLELFLLLLSSVI